MKHQDDLEFAFDTLYPGSTAVEVYNTTAWESQKAIQVRFSEMCTEGF